MGKVRSPSRLDVLRRLAVLDTPPEEAFDRLTRLARRLVGAPVALMSIVDADRQFFKSEQGLQEPFLAARGSQISHSFCQLVVEREQTLTVSDVRTDPVLSVPATELVGVAYAGAPIIVRGECVGALCALDSEPRQWESEQSKDLSVLANIAAAELELRLAAADASERAAVAERERAAKEAILASVLEAVCVINAQGRCTFVNERAARLLGASQEALLGFELRAFSNRTPPGSGDPWSLISAALHNEAVHAADVDLHRVDGELLHVEMSCGPIVMADGVSGAVVSFRDITARRRQQGLLEGQTTLLEMIATGTQLQDVLSALAHLIEAQVPGLLCSILLVDADRRLRTGAAPSLPAGFVQAIDGVEVGEAVGSCGTAAHRNEIVIVEDLRTSPLWAQFDCLAEQHGLRACWSTPVRSAVGDVIGTFAIYYREPRSPSADELQLIHIGGHLAGLAIDRTRREHELAEANRRKDEFLAVLAHELRNPLAPIVTGLELMKMRGNIGAVREREVIERQTHHLMRLVDDLLDISRVTRGKISLKKEVVEMRTVVAQALETVSPLLEEKRHRVSSVVPSEPLHVLADPDRLTQILANLLTNAGRYTAAGGAIEVELGVRGSDVTVTVRDNGTGIAPDLQPRIFDAFVQGERELDRSAGGLGLGLALARSLARLHDGDIAVHSEGPGCGSEFVVSLPRFESAQVPPGAPARCEPEARERRRVLVVDDNADAALMLAETLEMHGYTAAVAFDGPQALEVAAAFRPEIALLDLGLPIMDGYELASRLRGQTSPPPIMMAISGYGQESDLARSRACGFDAHFVKPILFHQLAAALTEAPRRTDPERRQLPDGIASARSA